VTFEANQEVVLSADQSGARMRITGRVTVLGEPRGRLLTIEVFVTSDLPTNARLSWIQLDAVPFVVSPEQLERIPPDLRGMALLLIEADFSGGDYELVDGVPMPPDTALAAKIQRERARLEGRFLATAWDVAPSGRVTLFVTGQLPVYDDIDAVNARAAVPPGQAYQVVGLASMATEDDLRSAGTDYPDYVLARYLQLPDGVTAETRALARSLAEGRGNPFDVARAIETDLRRRIEYDRSVGPTPSGWDAVDYVLFESRRGDCDFYASAMVVMLRSLGIPARLVTGFAPVPFDQAAQGYVYRRLDAHAWVEVYFPGFGWIPFEPTPSQDPRTYGEPAEATAAVEPTATPLATLAPTPTQEPLPPTAAGGGIVESPPDGGGSGRSRLLVGAMLAVIGIAGLSAGGLALAWRRGLSGLPLTAGWYARMVRAGRLVGVPREPSATPLEYASAVGRAMPAARRPATVLAELYAADRYGGGTNQSAGERSGQDAWRAVRRAALRRMLTPGRLRRRAPVPSEEPERGDR
jgi:transglutaminase-like putative cysteine protease